MSTPRYQCSRHGVEFALGGWCPLCEQEAGAAPVQERMTVRDAVNSADGRRARALLMGWGIEPDEPEPTGGAQKGDHYYRVTVRVPMSDELDPYVAECADIIEALDMTFNEGECFKALWRMCRARQGHGKPGSSLMYDAEKVEHYGRRVLMHATRRAT